MLNLSIFMASLDPRIKSPPFFMLTGHFIIDQMCGFKINDPQFFFFFSADETEVNYCSSLDLSADNLSVKDIVLTAKSLQLCLTLCDPLVAHQTPLYMAFSRQE